MRKVALGVIGCGVIGPSHIRAALQSPHIDVVAIADRREEARREAERFGAKKVYVEGDDLIEDPDIEAVVLALPACGRTALALHAFARGKHVLTEKPVAMNAAEVQQLIAARGSLVAGCCSARYRFLTSAQVVTDFIAGGALGDVRVVHARCISAAGAPPTNPPPAWRLIKALNGGGILMNWGCYDFDFLLGITGWSLRPRTVFAQTWPIAPHLSARAAPGSDAETHLTALIRCDGGTAINYERAEFAAAQTEDAWQIVGSKGSLDLRMVPGKNKRLVYYGSSAEKGAEPQVLWQSDDEDAAPINDGAVQDFCAAILQGRQPKTSLEHALIVQQIADAVYASAARGTAVEL